MSAVLSVVSFLIAFIVAYLFYLHRRKKNDQVWHVSEDELQFSNPVEVIGQGAFGVVVLANYRGTRVAIKRVLPVAEKGRAGSVVGSVITTSIEDKNELHSVDGDLGNLESGDRSSSMVRVVVNDDESSNSLRVLDNLGGLEHKTVLQRWFPFLAGNKSTSQYNSRILSKMLGHTTRTMTKRSAAQILCPLFDEAGRRRSEFITEMRLLSRLRHPCKFRWCVLPIVELQHSNQSCDT